jgi:probable F420-dependent oxidoreductase
MRLGVVAGNVGVDCIRNVREIPVAAEELGFDSVWFTDHVIGLKSYAPVYRGEWAEALTALTWAAATTSRVRLGLGVLVLPLRDPVLVAKVLATADQLSGGRLVIGVGTGWAYREYEALGRGPLFERRGAATDEALEVIRRCWEGGTFGWSGEWTSFKEIEFAPVPAQRPGPPIWVGGQSAPALRRAARFGDAWHPYGLTPQQVRDMGDELDEKAGRKVQRTMRLNYRMPEKAEALANVEAFVAAGCTDIVVEPKVETTDELMAELDELARNFLG